MAPVPGSTPTAGSDRLRKAEFGNVPGISLTSTTVWGDEKLWPPSVDFAIRRLAPVLLAGSEKFSQNTYSGPASPDFDGGPTTSAQPITVWSAPDTNVLPDQVEPASVERLRAIATFAPTPSPPCPSTTFL